MEHRRAPRAKTDAYTGDPSQQEFITMKTQMILAVVTRLIAFFSVPATAQMTTGSGMVDSARAIGQGHFVHFTLNHYTGKSTTQLSLCGNRSQVLTD
jgi:hypothetical protein